MIKYEPILTRTLSDLGYRREKRNVYRAEWSTEDVEHFLYFTMYGTPKEFFTAHFGLRNRFAESFSIGEIKRYGGRAYEAMKHDQTTDCSMSFSLGKLADWNPRWSLFLRDMVESDFSNRIKLDIQRKLFPVIREIINIEGLFLFLMRDDEPNPWFRTNGAIRAAQIAYLSKQLGKEAEWVKNELKSRNINASLARTLSSSFYIDLIIQDAYQNPSKTTGFRG